MGLLSIFKRQGAGAAESPASAQAEAPADAVAQARSRARRRLIGAFVLLGTGVIGFPLLFETQPRPIAVDIPIDIPNKDHAPALVLTPAPGASSTLSARVAPPPLLPETAERAGDQGREIVPPAHGASAASPPPRPASRTTVASDPGVADPPADKNPADKKPAGPHADKPADRPAAKPVPAASRPQDAARAQALLEGKPADAADARTVVQVGAFSDAAKLQQARSKLEKLGFKTYTQQVDVQGERRTRVRVGPFSNRAEADKAAARIKAAGLPAAILTL